MTWEQIRNSDWFQAFVVIVVGVFLLRIFLPIITIVLIAGLGLFLVLLFLDAAMQGTALQQIAEQVANWLQGFL